MRVNYLKESEYMITKNMFEEFLKWNPTSFDYFYCILFSIFTIPLDILLSPIELIAFIIWKIKE